MILNMGSLNRPPATEEELKQIIENDATAQLPNETPEKYSRFLDYLDQGPKRRLKKHWEENWSDVYNWNSFRQVAAEYKWRVRAAAYDLQLFSTMERALKIRTLELAQDQLVANKKWADELLAKAVDEETSDVKSASMLRAAHLLAKQILDAHRDHTQMQLKFKADIAKIEAMIVRKNRDEDDDLD